MVVTVFWTRSWTVPIISVSVLCVAVIFLLCCLCFVKKRSDSMRMSIQPRKKFFSISNSSLNKLMIFRSYDLSKNESATATVVPIQEKQGSESDLLDSVDLSKRFGSSRLQIVESDQEEMGSCGSADSKFTFYSTYQGLARSESAVSVASTYKSTRNSKNSAANHKSSSSLCIV